MQVIVQTSAKDLATSVLRKRHNIIIIHAMNVLFSLYVLYYC